MGWFSQRTDTKAAVERAVKRAETRTRRELETKYRDANRAILLSLAPRLREQVRLIEALRRDLADEQNANGRLQAEIDALRLGLDELTATAEARIRLQNMRTSALTANQAEPDDDY